MDRPHDAIGDHSIAVDTCNRFHQKRNVSWQISMPRSNSRSSTCRSESGYRMYIITVWRPTSGELLNQRMGFGTARSYGTQRLGSSRFALTLPGRRFDIHCRMLDTSPPEAIREFWTT